MAHDFTIRRAVSNDAEALTRLRVDFLQEVRPMDVATRVEVTEANRVFFEAYVDRDEFAAWVAEADGEIVATGMVSYTIRPPRAGSLRGIDAHLYGMYTVPSWRRRGIATAMLDEILRAVKQTDARCMLLNALDDGREIYKRAGFEPSADAMKLVW